MILMIIVKRSIIIIIGINKYKYENKINSLRASCIEYYNNTHTHKYILELLCKNVLVNPI